MTFHETLQKKMDDYVHLIYKITRNFPKDEVYGARSQIRRAALSVILNYTEGYARQQEKVLRNFLQISYGSLKESRYLLDFSLKEKWISDDACKEAIILADEIGAMLWSTIKNCS
ncbi:MAG TPA: four helix bundle protein [bacterium]|nr:MAG: hypothetical protein BWY14_00740 [Parcubacteria group bacterium ADurb.Bin192]HPN15341.1 four helix bundle protein [bacterium]